MIACARRAWLLFLAVAVLAGPPGLNSARAQLILDTLVPGGVEEIGIGGWPFVTRAEPSRELNYLLAVPRVQGGEVVLTGRVEDVARRSDPFLQMGHESGGFTVRVPVALGSFPGGIGLAVSRRDDVLEFALAGPGDAANVERYRARYQALSVSYGLRPTSLIDVAAGLWLDESSGYRPSYRVALALAGDRAVSVAISASGRRSAHSLRVEYGKERVGLPVRGYGANYGVKLMLAPSPNLAIELEEHAGRDMFRHAPAEQSRTYFVDGIATTRARRLSISRELGEDAEFSFHFGDSDSRVQGGVSEHGTRFCQGQVDLESLEWAAGVRFRPFRRSRCYADVSHTRYEGHVNGSLEAWPFTTGFIDLLGVRQRIESEGSLSLTSLHFGGERDIADFAVLRGGLRFLSVDGELSLDSWEPAFLGLGRRDEIEMTLELENTSIFVPCVGAAVDVGPLRLDGAVAQFIPVRGAGRADTDKTGDDDGASGGGDAGIDRSDSKVRGGTLLTARLVYRFE
ncbi:hypothetical protein AMJ39_06525 [candidate division TA06 bacterium DG_24]|uniref:Uncharacterized protein n=2 Tax=Bacteria division TA06 TaxID=1156500 RepID=A0A0S8JFQ9_UNCT6|nr:MAG: hypothetical protein AMJ39_06525 [candidate division TA06 bacterium DG_24]KPL07470.1 MAG: hypothetical protein AMJ71_08945 [candidate division TA06 bacterium SM1_40]